jgi:HEPN domain-containing protein
MTPPEPYFERDPKHWLYRHSPDEWMRAAIAELAQAETRLQQRDRASAVASLKRAAGMALNAVLIERPNAEWGRTYVEHIRALTEDEHVPGEVREAARSVLQLRAPSGAVVTLQTRSEDERWVEATRTVMAHAYALVYGSTGRQGR